MFGNEHNVPACGTVCVRVELPVGVIKALVGVVLRLTSIVLRFPPTGTDQLPFRTSGGHMSAAAAARAQVELVLCQLSSKSACPARCVHGPVVQFVLPNDASSTDKLGCPGYKPRVNSRDVVLNSSISVKPANFGLENQRCVTS